MKNQYVKSLILLSLTAIITSCKFSGTYSSPTHNFTFNGEWVKYPVVVNDDKK